MLRLALLVFAALLSVAGLFCLSSGYGHGLPMTVWGVILLLAVLFERWRYQQSHNANGAWQETGERFIDPESGRLTKVLYDPHSGERRYVPVDADADKGQAP
ncbi:MAG: hypothetical protein JO269_01395 [Burkholderiaceae bacterium]|nr:hypothetical protein [Burkholderiaceae bacterium]